MLAHYINWVGLSSICASLNVILCENEQGEGLEWKGKRMEETVERRGMEEEMGPHVYL